MIKEKYLRTTGNYEQVCRNFIYYCIKDVVNKYKFVCLVNNVAGAIERKILPGPFQILSNDFKARNGANGDSNMLGDLNLFV